MDRMTTATAAGAGLSPLTGAIQLIYSKEILYAAQPVLKVANFATVKTELGRQPGQTVQFLKYDNPTMGGQLTEGIRMETKAITTQTIDISIYEQGNAFKTSELLLQVSFDDVMASMAKLLGRDYAKVLDIYCRNVIRRGTSVSYGYQSSASTADPGTSRTTTNYYLDTRVVKDAVETLATNNSPKINGDYYVCFAHPHQLRRLRDDTNWLNSRYYARPEDVLNGEVGRYEDVRFIETTIMPQGANSGQTDSYDGTLATAGSGSTNLYQGFMFGENAYGLAYGLEVELRDNGIEDFGREHGLAWYSIYGSDIIEDNNIVVIETT